MSCPDFACMGFQKCGTTTLFEILKQHPDVVLCRDVKEPMYYRVPGFIQKIGRGHKFYRWRYFVHVKEGDERLKGEVNAGLTFTHCEEKIARDMDPQMKMIFMLRDPVNRSYSSYKYFLARGFLPREALLYDQAYGHAEGFDHYVHSILDSPRRKKQIMKKRLKYLVLSQSNYAWCIQEYLQDFPKENMKFVVFEEFIQDQHAACLEIYDFLGIGDYPQIDYRVRANEGNERAVSDHLVKKLKFLKGWKYGFYEFVNMTKWAPKTYRRFNRYYNRIRAQAMRPDEDKSKVLPKTRKYLLEYFGPDIRKLSEITGKDLEKIWHV